MHKTPSMNCSRCSNNSSSSYNHCNHYSNNININNSMACKCQRSLTSRQTAFLWRRSNNTITRPPLLKPKLRKKRTLTLAQSRSNTRATSSSPPPAMLHVTLKSILARKMPYAQNAQKHLRARTIWSNTGGHTPACERRSRTQPRQKNRVQRG